MRVPLFRGSLAGGTMILGLFLVLTLMAPCLVPHDPLAIDLDRRLESPSPVYPLGTDPLGRCLLSRLLLGTRVTLGAGCLAAFLSLGLGLGIGLLAGLTGGKADMVLMRLVDMGLAFPSLILALAVVGVLGPSLHNALVAVVAVWWARYARLVRGMILTAKEKEFVMAARIVGSRGVRLVITHILPQVTPVLAVLVPLEAGRLIVVLSALSFLGFGAQPPLPEWGAMLNEARPYFQSHPRLMLAPGGAIFLAVLGLNLFAEGLRDALQVRKPAEWNT